MRSSLRVLAAASVLVLGSLGVADANPLDPPSSACTDVAAPTDPSCYPSAGLGHLTRQACDYHFVAGCEATALEDPGYSTTVDPSPTGAYRWRTGAVHEHSGYSDGDPGSTPSDYFAAARTGRNGSDTGVQLDFLFSSEHSDNATLTVTTNEACVTDPATTVVCAHATDNTFWWKWPSALRQAREATTDTFTAMRGFEWTNDITNHMNVYFSTNFRNVKVDGSYLDLQRMWDWLQLPVAQGGGADALVTLNHPGSSPKLSPFDGSLPHSALLESETSIDNWNEVAFVPEVVDRVVGMEVNGGEDIEWFVKALRNGWRLGPVAAEDHHGTSWASESMGKALLLTKGTSVRDHYWAMANRRTIALHHELVGGAPGTRAVVPTIDFTGDGHVLGSRVPNGSGAHRLRVGVKGLPRGYRVALIGSEGGLEAPIALSTVGGKGIVNATYRTPAGSPPGWWFAVVCPPGPDPCGTTHDYSAVTAPIWFE